MKIVHICLPAPYTDGWGYQENYLSTYHFKLGNEVTIITTNTKHTNDGKIIDTEIGSYFYNDIKIIRKAIKPFITKKLGKITNFYDIYNDLKQEMPDFIMIHGLVSISALQVRKYKNKINAKCVVVADTHADAGNTKLRGGIKSKILRIYYILINKLMQKTYRTVYGVTPNCRQIAYQYYKINKQKLQLLPLGVDDFMINDLASKINIKEIRGRFGCEPEQKIIITGGKLDYKKNIHLLIEAINKLDNKNIRLIIFGTPTNILYEQKLRTMVENKHNIYLLGHLNITSIYELFLSSDLAIFPGTQSVLWQQAIGCGLPIICKDWGNMNYLDFGGNISLLKEDSVVHLSDKIKELLFNPNQLGEMKGIAQVIAKNKLAYSLISNLIITGKNWEEF